MALPTLITIQNVFLTAVSWANNTVPKLFRNGATREIQLNKKQICKATDKKQSSHQSPHTKTGINRKISKAEQPVQMPDIGKALDALMQPEQAANYLPYQFKKNNKKKKRKRIYNNQ